MSEKKISFGRVFWPTFWSALIVSLLGVLVWFIVIGSFMSSFEPKGMEIKDKTILHLTLEGQITERSGGDFNPLSFSMDKGISLAALLHGIDEAKNDDKIKGLFLEIDNLTCGLAAAKEIRDAINAFESSGKFVVAYNAGEVVSTGEYYLASAADENYGFPGSNVNFLGLGAEMTFFKNTLEKMDIEVQVVRGSDNHFKSAVEPFFRDNMSDSARVQTERLLESVWKDMRIDIGKDRGVSIEELNDLAEKASIVNVEDAVKYKLMDAAKYRDEVMAILAEKVKKANDETLHLFSFSKYAKKRFYQNQTLAKEDDPNIAVILAEGAITKNGDALTSEDICKLFKEARENKTIKTVVFRISSGGGSALASEEIWREVKLTNDKKKVIVSMGDYAASGGYYIASPASYIFAQPTTITGSIGVFGAIPYTGAMFENKLGMTFDRASTNKHSIMTTNKKLSEKEFALIQNSVDDIYDLFKQRVADGRGMTKNEVNIIGRGRVWTGTDAVNIGLVDELGGMQDAIKYAADKAGIKDKKLLFYPQPKEDKLGEFFEQLEENSSTSVKQHQLPTAVIKHYNELMTLESIEGIQMRIPYTIDIK